MPYFLQFLRGRITHEEFTDASQQDRVRELLAHNHISHATVYCTCQTSESPGLPLAVVLRRNYFLRCHKQTGPRHQEDCTFFEKSAQPGQHRSVPGVREEPDGSLSLRLAASVFPLDEQTRADQAKIAAPSIDAASHEATDPNKGVIRLLGIFRLLLERAGVSEWNPRFVGKRTPYWLTCRVAAAARQMNVPRAGSSLGDMILWPYSVITTDSLAAHLLSPAAFRFDDCREALLFGHLLSVRPSSTGKTVLLTIDWVRGPIYCYKDTWAELSLRFSNALQFSSDSPRYPTLALMTLRVRAPKPGDPLFITLSSIAPVVFSNAGVPCESGYEIVMANYLVSEQRQFTKPLRCSPKDELFPDFILSDTDPATYIEVWGRSDPLYLARKETKKKRYLEKRIPLLEWAANEDAPLPRLPARAG